SGRPPSTLFSRHIRNSIGALHRHKITSHCSGALWSCENCRYRPFCTLLMFCFGLGWFFRCLVQFFLVSSGRLICSEGGKFVFLFKGFKFENEVGKLSGFLFGGL